MKRTKCSLSHYKLFSCDMGELIPAACYEVLPGDSVQQMSSVLVRVSPLLAPIMHPVQVRIHHWFVPLRLLWNNFENFITGGPDGLDATVPPTLNANIVGGTPLDYMGVPPRDYAALPISALPLRAYCLIWNEWYRDQDLQAAVPLALTDGDDNVTLNTMLNVCWEKDYFTTARPWPQKGAEVTLPLGESAGFTRTIAGVRTPRIIVTNAAGGVAPIVVSNTPGGLAGDEILVDLTGATSATVRDLREAFALQRYAEARARYGSRYTEYLAYLGVRSSDSRLQRPEYLGGGKQVLQFSEVLQTGVTTSGNGAGVGNLKGHGIGAMRSNRYRRFFEEHGIVLSLLSVKPKTMYGTSLARMWSRKTKSGQPASRSAWVDSNINALSNDFYCHTLKTMEGTYLRPRYPGFIRFHEEGGLVIHRCLRGELTIKQTLQELNYLFQDTKVVAS